MKITERFKTLQTLHNPTQQVQTEPQTLHTSPGGAKQPSSGNSGGKVERIGLLLVELEKWDTPRTRKDIARMKTILGQYKPGIGWEDRFRNEMILLVNSVTNKECSGAELYEMVKEI